MLHPADGQKRSAWKEASSWDSSGMTETKLLKLKSLTILNGSLLQLIKSIRAWSGAEGSGEIETGANEILLCTYCRSVEVSATIRGQKTK